jgi:DNA-binding response OmpR family regulator
MAGPIGRILVVDDEPNIRFFLERVLSREGHEVVTVESGKEALLLVKEKKEEFDLALVDLKLKEMNGTELLPVLREAAPYLSIIILTGYASLETSVEALRQGAHDYLFKPTRADELRESVRTGLLKRNRELRRQQLLTQLEQNLAHSLEEIRSTVVTDPEDSSLPPESSTSSPRLPLRHGALTVDFARHLVTLDGRQLSLSPTEFDVLAYLAAEAPRVISPEEMVREVQEYECQPWEARDTVRYHIYRLRNKIKEATEYEDIIRTVRGVGYTLNLSEL